MEVLRPYYNNELSILSSNLCISVDELSKYIESEINKHINIDPYKVLNKLIVNSTKINRNGREWLRANLYILLREHQNEIAKDIQINPTPLYNTFRELGFSGDDVDKYLIEEIELCILGQPHVRADEIAYTNEKILDYMVAKNEKTYDRFIYYLMKSKLVKEHCNIDLNLLREKVKTELDDFNEMLKKLEEKKRERINK